MKLHIKDHKSGLKRFIKIEPKFANPEQIIILDGVRLPYKKAKGKLFRTLKFEERNYDGP